ncbi:YfhO family protein, partial [bacterium]|nr:YfhO family protein [bacterium]
LMQDNRWAYWNIASLGGYHGAKMRSYQDLVDNVFYSGPDRRAPLNVPFFSAMNCKYFVAEGQLPDVLHLELVGQDPAARQLLYRNPQALNRVYFVDSVIVIPDRAETIRRLTQPNFLWNYMAVLEKPLPGPSIPHPDKTATITSYSTDYVRIAARVPTASLMVFSDAYYAPGWEAIDNGIPTTIYKVNGFVRGLYLRPGEHTIEFRYSGNREHVGETVATVSHFLAWGLVIGGWLLIRKRRKAEGK